MYGWWLQRIAVNAHLTVGKYCRLTNEITDYKIVALEFKLTSPPSPSPGFCFLFLS
jgi:hypothetical protein